MDVFLNNLPDINRSLSYAEGYALLHQFQEALKQYNHPRAQVLVESIRAVLNESIKVAELEKAVRTMKIVRPGHGKRKSIRLSMKPLSGEEMQKIVSEFRNGKGAHRIADEMHRPPGQIKNVLRRYGLTPFKNE